MPALWRKLLSRGRQVSEIGAVSLTSTRAENEGFYSKERKERKKEREERKKDKKEGRKEGRKEEKRKKSKIILCVVVLL